MNTGKEFELTTRKSQNAVNGQHEHENGEAQKQNETLIQIIISSVIKFFAFFTVEPFLLCYIIPNIISSVAVFKLNMEKACRADLNVSKEICDQAIGGETENNTFALTALQDSQILVANMTAWSIPLQSSVPALLLLFIGAWSDRTGNRKVLMMVPLIGEIISSSLLILATYYFTEWPLWITAVFETLPTALCGGLSIALMGAYSFLADVTTAETRTFRIGIAGVIVTLGIPLGSAISGVLEEAVGYYGVFGINITIYIIGLTHTFFRVHDVRRNKIEGTCCSKFFQFLHPRNAWDTLSLLVMSRGRKLAQLVLIIWAHIVLIGPVFGEGALTFLYVNLKFSMSLVDFSLYQTYSTIVGLVGTTIAVTIFSKFLKWHDAVLGMLATICKTSAQFVYAFAPTRQWFFGGPVVDLFGNVGVPAIRSLGTKVVEPAEVGKMCSLIGLIEAVVPVIYTPIYSKIYAASVKAFLGLHYVVGGIMTIPAFFIFVALYFIHKRQQRDVVQNPAEKEKYAHENDVTYI